MLKSTIKLESKKIPSSVYLTENKAFLFYACPAASYLNVNRVHNFNLVGDSNQEKYRLTLAPARVHTKECPRQYGFNNRARFTGKIL